MKSASKNIFNFIGILFGANEQDIVPSEFRQRQVLLLTMTGIIIQLAFGIFNLVSPSTQLVNYLGASQIIEFVVLLIPTYLIARFGKNPVFAEYMLIFSAFYIFAVSNVFGGHSGNMPYWTFVFPYIVFFLRGQKAGWLIGALYALVAPILMYLGSTVGGLWPYAPQLCLYYGLAYLFNLLTASYFNLLRGTFEQTLWEQVEYRTNEARQHLDKLHFNATHDNPTGLLNRQGIINALADILISPNYKNNAIQVICIQFFRVKELAGIMGMDKIDESLTLLAGKLEQTFPNLASIGRYDHDQLTLIVCNTFGEDTLNVILNIRHIRDAKNLGDFSVHEEFAVGVVEHNCTEKGTASDLIRKAEQALLYACDNKLDYQFYDATLNDYFEARNLIYEKLREALFSDQLNLHYQPQIDLKTKQIVGAEALARWLDPEDGIISPTKFMPIIESTGVLQRFSIWTVDMAIRDCASWQKHLPNVSVSINFSANAMHEPEVLRNLEAALLRWRLDPALVIVELTESVLLKSPLETIAKLNVLVEKGVKLSIDDYGAGFSSLTYLKQLPAHEMKIDMSFVLNVASNEQDQAIVRSSIDLAHDLGLKVLAEGIEDKHALELLTKAGCDLGQGWYFTEALAYDEFITWSTDYTAMHSQKN